MLRWRLLVAAALILPGKAVTQQRDSVVATGTPEARADKAPPRWKWLHVNEVQTPWTTIRLGGGFLPEIAAYKQDDDSRVQVAQMRGVTLDPLPIDPPELRGASLVGPPLFAVGDDPGDLVTQGKIRDSRLLIGGRLATQRKITWQTGLMYDWATKKWFVRQTGFVIDVPEIYSNFWVGRTKEGPSLNRVMIGYDGWTMERFPISDAIPLLADGVRWQGYMPHLNLIWNLGYFVDYLSENESFSHFKNQVAGRVGYLKMDSDTAGSLVHLALGFQAGVPDDATLQLKSKPEASGAPHFIDTGEFPATAAQLLGIEAYYRLGPWLFGTEYYAERAQSPQTDNPVFHGGDIFAAWLMTGETRPYVALGSVFRDISPTKPVFDGGPGAIEWGLRLSNTDLNSGTLQGGTFWRLTPFANWYLSDNVRLELGYGYGVLTRFGTTGATHFFQSRLQLQL